MKALKVMSLNCRVWTRDIKDGESNWRKRYKAIAKCIETHNPDILCLQELSWPSTSYIPDNYKRATHGVSHSIWVRKGLSVKSTGWCIHYDWADVDGVRIVNVHSRWNEGIRERNKENIIDLCKSTKLPIIAVGDYNNEYSQWGSMEEADMLMHEVNEDTFENFTRPTESHGEIDLIYYRGFEITATVDKSEDYGVKRISDHWPLIMTLNF